MRLLLDTHVLVWWHEKAERLSPPARRALKRLSPENPALVSDFSLWEIANLVHHKRLKLSLDLRAWLEQATSGPLVEVVSITPEIAAEVAALGDSMHKDPADRVIVATARVLGATLVTEDSLIRDAGICRLL